MRRLVSASQENDQIAVSPLEVNAVARSVIDSQLRNALANWLNVPWITNKEALNSNLDFGAPANVSQAIEPFREFRSLENSNHERV